MHALLSRCELLMVGDERAGGIGLENNRARHTHVPRNSKTSSGSMPKANLSSLSTPNAFSCSALSMVESSSAVRVACNNAGGK